MKEIRISELSTEKRSREDKPEEMIIKGYPIVFESETTIGGQYKEVIKRGALDGVNLNNTRLLVNHSQERIPLARTPKTMTLSINDKGLEMIATLPDTEEGRSVYTAVERGDLSGMSFSFTVSPEGQTYNHETKTRTIHKIDNIYEISIVNFPAYEATSVVSAEARSQIEALGSKDRDNLRIKLNRVLFNTMKERLNEQD